MSARLLAIGTAVPERSITQDDVAEVACRLAGAGARTRALRAVYRKAGIERRGSVLLDGDGELSFYGPSTTAGPTTAERLQRYTSAAVAMAGRACVQALERAGARAERVTHLVTVSCTGFEAPGVDLMLIESLGLPATTRRTHVGFMGCHGAINGLAVARAFAEADDDACVLVCCVELCTLHFQYGDHAEEAVANALFADGAAAAVVSSGRGPRAPVLRTAQSVVIPETAGCMTWRIGDHGFVMSLSSRVPGVLAEAVPVWVGGWLDSFGLKTGDVRSWAVHPGGPRVVGAVAEGLGLDDEAVEDSRAVLREHGNMSSPTVLFIMERLLRREAPLPLVAMAFGPGLAGEAVLLT